MRPLYERGYSKEDILELFRLIDWLVQLPRELEVEFRRQVAEYEAQKHMPYITSIERLGRDSAEGIEGALAVFRRGIAGGQHHAPVRGGERGGGPARFHVTFLRSRSMKASPGMRLDRRNGCPTTWLSTTRGATARRIAKYQQYFWR
jgi:hypothetical protein